MAHLLGRHEPPSIGDGASRKEIAMSRIPALDPAAAGQGQGSARCCPEGPRRHSQHVPRRRPFAHGSRRPAGPQPPSIAARSPRRCASSWRWRRREEQLRLLSFSAHVPRQKRRLERRRRRPGAAGPGRRPKADAAVRFTRSLVDNRGHPSDAELVALRRGGFSDGEIVDLVAATALNIFTNYLNRVAETEIDFPVARSGVATAA
jgi:hypothetical protein